jgi:hypothetical protein
MDSPSGAHLVAATMTLCDRCNRVVKKSGRGEDSRVDWMGWKGHRLCWEIYLGMWVLAQPPDERMEALAFVDSITGKR